MWSKVRRTFSARVDPRRGVERGVAVELVHHLFDRDPVFGAKLDTEPLVQLGDDPGQRLHLFRQRSVRILGPRGIEHALLARQSDAAGAGLLDAVRLHVDVLLHFAGQFVVVHR